VSPKPGRRPGAGTTTRATILQAARRRFSEHGFAQSSVRAIAADAQVDPALVMHYFGTKADLFAATLDLPIVPSEQLTALDDVDAEHLGEAILRMLAGVWAQPDRLEAWLGMVRSGIADPAFAELMREFIVKTLTEKIGPILDAPDLELRIGLVASQVVGLSIARYIVGFPLLASMTTDEMVAAVAPTLQRYLTGDLSP